MFRPTEAASTGLATSLVAPTRPNGLMPSPQPPSLMRATSNPAAATLSSATSRFGAPQVELTKALTSIVSPPVHPVSTPSLLAHLPVDFDATPEEVAQARADEIDRIMRTLPGRDAIGYLVERYFDNVAWLFHHLHAPSYVRPPRVPSLTATDSLSLPQLPRRSRSLPYDMRPESPALNRPSLARAPPDGPLPRPRLAPSLPLASRARPDSHDD